MELNLALLEQSILSNEAYFYEGAKGYEIREIPANLKIRLKC